MNQTTKTKIKIGLLGGIYALFILVLATLLFEGLGTFVGYVIDRPFAAKYISKNYTDIECSFVNAEYINEKRVILGVEQTYKTYRFNYKVKSLENEYGTLCEGNIFSIDVYNFKVLRDSIYMEYNQDTELIAAANQALHNELVAFAEDNENVTFAVFDAYIDAKINAGSVESLEALLNSDTLTNSDQIIHVLGEKCTFDEYKIIISPIVEYYQKEDKTVPTPNNVQIFYYYSDEKGEKVMAFESEIEHYQLNFDKKAIANAEKMHYKVELSEDDIKQAKIYNIIKIVYLVVLGGTVIALYTLFTVRKLRKLMGKIEK